MKAPDKLKVRTGFANDPTAFSLMDGDLTVANVLGSDKEALAKEVAKRYNAYDGMLMELKESLKDLKNWDGTPEAMEIIQLNIKDRIKKAKSGALN